MKRVSWYRRSRRHTINETPVSALDDVLFETFVDLTSGDARDEQSRTLALQSLEDAIALDRHASRGIYPHIKRAIDVTVAAVGLILLTPLMLMIGVAIALESGGPILYADTREGIHGRVFRCLKFRTMRTSSATWPSYDASPEPVPTFSITEDPRITRLGRILRKLKLDKLPQLVNVLMGDMSLIGPRPWPASTGRNIELAVRPGLTGLSQRLGHDGFPAQRRLLELDFLYEDRVSFSLDVRILLSFLGLGLPTARMTDGTFASPKRESAVQEIERRFTTADLAVERRRHRSH